VLRAVPGPVVGAALLLGALLARNGIACAAGPIAPSAAASSAAIPPGWAKDPGELRPAARARVLREAEVALTRLPRPVATLASAGGLDRADPTFVASRAAFEDADDAVLLALAWRATGAERYRAAAAGRLLAWAFVNVPTGHPIDETRLDGLVSAYVLMGASLGPAQAIPVRKWLTTMRDRKAEWVFGPKTRDNNHHTHQLKMRALLDAALGDAERLAADAEEGEALAARNLDTATGESVDLRERDALYYHAYNLDAWLELRLATGCCVAPVTAAFDLLERRVLAGETAGEFVASVAPLDAARGRAGFGYGAPGTAFDPARATHAILSFYTGPDAQSSPFALSAADVARRDLYPLARYESWLP